MFKGLVSLYRTSNKILQSSDFKTFSGLCMYHFSAILNPHFSHSFQWSILATLSCLAYLYFFYPSFEHSETMCATVSSAAPHTRKMDWAFSPNTTFLIFLVYRTCSSTATIVLSVSFFKSFLQQIPWSFASYFLCNSFKLSMKMFSFILFSMIVMYFFFTSSILIVFNDSAATYFF